MIGLSLCRVALGDGVPNGTATRRYARAARALRVAAALALGGASVAGAAASTVAPPSALIGVWEPQDERCSFRRVEFTARQQIIDTYGPERTGYPAEHSVKAVFYTATEPGHVWITPAGYTPSRFVSTDWEMIDRDHVTPGRATGCVYRRARR